VSLIEDANTNANKTELAPPPDFRYVGLASGDRVRRPIWAATAFAAAAGLASFAHGGARIAIAIAALASSSAFIVRAIVRSRSKAAHDHDQSIAIVPWGVLIDPADERRVLRWAAVKEVRVEMVHGRDSGTATTRYSVVHITTEREKLAGTSVGAVPLDRLLAHLDSYTREQSHVIALDLDGTTPSDGPIEPDCEPLLEAARAYVKSAPASDRLSLPPADYRHASTPFATKETIAVLRRVLRDRTPHPIDPRAFAAVVAAELRATDLAEDLVDLVQSPHPVIAAIAKVAAKKLGMATARAGALDEVAPFIMERDVETLTAWASNGLKEANE
jgi:hypothetical protein